MVHLSILRRVPCVWAGLSLAGPQCLVLGIGFQMSEKQSTVM